jgi:hypothetical protein
VAGFSTPGIETSSNGHLSLHSVTGLQIAEILPLHISPIAPGNLNVLTAWKVEPEFNTPGVLSSACFEFVISGRLDPYSYSEIVVDVGKGWSIEYIGATPNVTLVALLEKDFERLMDHAESSGRYCTASPYESYTDYSNAIVPTWDATNNELTILYQGSTTIDEGASVGVLVSGVRTPPHVTSAWTQANTHVLHTRASLNRAIIDARTTMQSEEVTVGVLQHSLWRMVPGTAGQVYDAEVQFSMETKGEVEPGGYLNVQLPTHNAVGDGHGWKLVLDPNEQVDYLAKTGTAAPEPPFVVNCTLEIVSITEANGDYTAAVAAALKRVALCTWDDTGTVESVLTVTSPEDASWQFAVPAQSYILVRLQGFASPAWARHHYNGTAHTLSSNGTLIDAAVVSVPPTLAGAISEGSSVGSDSNSNSSWGWSVSDPSVLAQSTGTLRVGIAGSIPIDGGFTLHLPCGVGWDMPALPVLSLVSWTPSVNTTLAKLDIRIGLNAEWRTELCTLHVSLVKLCGETCTAPVPDRLYGPAELVISVGNVIAPSNTYPVTTATLTTQVFRPLETWTHAPTASPTNTPTITPTSLPTKAPTLRFYTYTPTLAPTLAPSAIPTVAPPPTSAPTHRPTSSPSGTPTMNPTNVPTAAPSMPPTIALNPTYAPSLAPTSHPTLLPTLTSDAGSSRIIDGPNNITVCQIRGLIAAPEPLSSTISSSLTMGDCSAGNSFDAQAQENLKKSIAESIDLDDWTLIVIKSASCNAVDDEGRRRLATGGKFVVDFDIAIPTPTAAAGPAPAPGASDASDAASALQSATFLSDMATSFNTAQAETGGAALDVSGIAVVVADTTSGGASRLWTRESGIDKDTTIMLSLARQPTSDVTVSISSSDLTEADVNPRELVFTPTTNGALVVNVIGVDDSSVDGDQPYSIRMHFESDDKRFQYDNAYELVNKDDDSYGMVLEFVDPSKNVTSEMGAEVKARLRLTAQPTGSVVVTALVTKSAEASLYPTVAVLGPGTWDTGVEFTLTGQADGVPDGDTTYELHASVVLSVDTGFNGIAVEKLTVGSRDEPLNEVRFNMLNTSFKCATSEDDATYQVVKVQMQSWPLDARDKMYISVHRNPGPKFDEGVTWLLEGSNGQPAMAQASQEVTVSNWQLPIPIAIQGARDNEVDGTQNYQVFFEATVAYYEIAPELRSLPPSLLPDPIQCASRDIDVASITWADQNDPDYLYETSEIGAIYNLLPRFTSRPLEEVRFLCLSSDNTEGKIEYEHIYGRDQWATGITIVVVGQDDDLVDGNIDYRISCMTSSGDAMYNDQEFDFNFTNVDNDVQGLGVWQSGKKLSGYALPVDETGIIRNVTIGLVGMPTGTVYVHIKSSDTSELQLRSTGGFSEQLTLIFTVADWDTRQYLEYKGIDDSTDDGDTEVLVDFSIIFPTYELDWSFTVVNRDDDGTSVDAATRKLLPSFQLQLPDVQLFSSASDFQPAMLLNRDTPYGLAVLNGVLAFLQSMGTIFPADAVLISLNNSELYIPAAMNEEAVYNEWLEEQDDVVSSGRLLFDSRAVRTRAKRALLEQTFEFECSKNKSCPLDSFCNYEMHKGGFCEFCRESIEECFTIGLPVAGEQDCVHACGDLIISRILSADKGTPTVDVSKVEQMSAAGGIRILSADDGSSGGSSFGSSGGSSSGSSSSSSSGSSDSNSRNITSAPTSRPTTEFEATNPTKPFFVAADFNLSALSVIGGIVGDRTLKPTPKLRQLSRRLMGFMW